jgi:hypothetical protein
MVVLSSVYWASEANKNNSVSCSCSIFAVMWQLGTRGQFRKTQAAGVHLQTPAHRIPTGALSSLQRASAAPSCSWLQLHWETETMATFSLPAQPLPYLINSSHLHITSSRKSSLLSDPHPVFWQNLSISDNFHNFNECHHCYQVLCSAL